MNKYCGSFISALLFVIIIGCSSVEQAGSEEDTDEEGTTDFPDQPIEMIVSYEPGAATDAQARILTQYAQEEFGEQVAIINMEGAGGSVGWNHFIQQDADGYTIAAYNLPHILSKPLVEEVEYSYEDFDPIANWGYDPTAFAVLPDSPYESIDDIVEEAEENPGSITVGNAGLYVAHHIGTLMLEDEADISLQSVEFDGASEAQSALMGGHIDVQAGNVSDLFRLGDEVEIIAVASEERHEFIPDTPTFQELGYDIEISTDRGIAAVDGTPPEIVERLEEGFINIMNRDDFQEEMERAGADQMIMDGDETEEEFEERYDEIEELLDQMGEIN